MVRLKTIGNNAVKYMCVAGKDLVTGVMDYDFAMKLCENAELNKEYAEYPIKAKNGFYFQGTITENKKREKGE